MTPTKRFIWGLVSGLVIVLVKVIGPDQEFIKSIFLEYATPAALFYLCIAIATMLLGAISGLFSEENSPAKLLIFCASFPALVTTYTAKPNDPIPTETSAAKAKKKVQHWGFPSFVSSANAQEVKLSHVCNETDFANRFFRTARQYFGKRSYSEQPYFAVVVASSKDFEKAKKIATKLNVTAKILSPYVGCRKPGNEYYPIIVGKPGNKIESSVLKGRVEGMNLLPQTPYLSYYEYRRSIYSPS